MNTVEEIKAALARAFARDPNLHISISLTKPHVELTDLPVKLVGVHRHIFQIEAERNGRIERYSLQYGDVLSGIVQIAELG